MRLAFPYIKKGEVFYPVVDLTVLGKVKSLSVSALIDSGASFSIFRPEIAEYLDIDIEKGKSLFLEGVGGRILGYLHRIPVKVGDRRFVCKIIFSREFTVSFNLIGRDNFFQKFLITFAEAERLLILE